MTDADLRTVYVPLDEVQPALRNPKKHDLELLQASICRFGFVEPGIVDGRTGRIVAGHGRAEALRAMRDGGQSAPTGIRVDETGRWLVPVTYGWASRSDAEAESYLVITNTQSGMAGWEDEGLAQILSDLQDTDPELMMLTGYDDDSLAALLNAGALGGDLGPGDGLPPPGDAPTDDLHSTWGVIVTCRDESDQVELLRRFSGEGREVRALIA